MTITIHKGNHRPGIFQMIRQLGLFNGSKAMERIVEFDITAKYDLNSDDNNDVNKLFGFGYINGGHHTDSARFGWNWNNETAMVNLYAYYYNQGLRGFKKICEVPINTKLVLRISNMRNRYEFSVYKMLSFDMLIGAVEIFHAHNKKWAYKLGCYFGGNPTAPHDITTKIYKR